MSCCETMSLPGNTGTAELCLKIDASLFMQGRNLEAQANDCSELHFSGYPSVNEVLATQDAEC